MMDDLPKILKTTMDNLLQDGSVLSWIIKGGPDFTQVSIRFTNALQTATGQDIKYRRASPSRMRRDN